MLLNKNYSVTVIDNFATGRLDNLRNKKIKVVDQSITNYEKIEKYFKNVDYVFHLAGLADIVPSIENPSKYFDTNVKGTLNVLKASKKNNVKKVVYAASASCYGLVKNFQLTKKQKNIYRISLCFNQIFG